MDRKKLLKKNKSYLWMKNISRIMDQYYLDGIVGILPWGIGDILTAILTVVFLYFSSFRLHSLPLSLAIINNTLRDIAMGMVPFFVGNIIDFFHKSNKKNMELIEGFINNDKTIIRKVNQKASWMVISILLFLLAIVALFCLLIWLASKVYLLFT